MTQIDLIIDNNNRLTINREAYRHCRATFNTETTSLLSPLVGLINFHITKRRRRNVESFYEML